MTDWQAAAEGQQQDYLADLTKIMQGITSLFSNG